VPEGTVTRIRADARPPTPDAVAARERETGELRVLVDQAEFDNREAVPAPRDLGIGCGRELFGFLRAAFSSAEKGASVFTEELEALK